MYRADLTLPGTPCLYVLGTLLEALIEANCRWYLEEIRAGRKPPCCAGCGGVVWAPDDVTRRWRGGSQMVDHPSAGYSCHEIAGYDCGVARAKLVLQGVPMVEARRVTYGDFEQRRDGTLHAIYVTPKGKQDGTRKMPTRKAAA